MRHFNENWLFLGRHWFKKFLGPYWFGNWSWKSMSLLILEPFELFWWLRGGELVTLSISADSVCVPPVRVNHQSCSRRQQEIFEWRSICQNTCSFKQPDIIRVQCNGRGYGLNLWIEETQYQIRIAILYIVSASVFSRRNQLINDQCDAPDVAWLRGSWLSLLLSPHVSSLSETYFRCCHHQQMSRHRQLSSSCHDHNRQLSYRPNSNI